jgi:hypothetical protein
MTKFMVYSTKNRETGTLIELYDTQHPENAGRFEGALRWAIYCVEHHEEAYYEKQGMAFPAMTRPHTWCKSCKDMKEKGEKLPLTRKSEAPKAQSAAKPPAQPKPEPEVKEEVPIDPKG